MLTILRGGTFSYHTTQHYTNITLYSSYLFEHPCQECRRTLAFALLLESPGHLHIVTILLSDSDYNSTVLSLL